MFDIKSVVFRSSVLSRRRRSSLAGLTLRWRGSRQRHKEAIFGNNRSWCLCWFSIVYYDQVAFSFSSVSRKRFFGFCCRDAYQSVKNVESSSRTSRHCSRRIVAIYEAPDLETFMGTWYRSVSRKSSWDIKQTLQTISGSLQIIMTLS